MSLATNVRRWLRKLFSRTAIPADGEIEREQMYERSRVARERLERNIDTRIRMLKAEAELQQRHRYD